MDTLNIAIYYKGNDIPSGVVAVQVTVVCPLKGSVEFGRAVDVGSATGYNVITESLCYSSYGVTFIYWVMHINILLIMVYRWSMVESTLDRLLFEITDGIEVGPHSLTSSFFISE